MCIAFPRRHRLHKFVSTFPEGRAGAGLAILRTTVAVHAIAAGIGILAGSGSAVSSTSVLGISAVALSVAMLAGFLTSIASSILSAGYLVNAVSLLVSSDAGQRVHALTAGHLASMCGAVALLGPGAFSIDARLFGLLEIIIPERRRPSSKD